MTRVGEESGPLPVSGLGGIAGRPQRCLKHPLPCDVPSDPKDPALAARHRSEGQAPDPQPILQVEDLLAGYRPTEIKALLAVPHKLIGDSLGHKVVHTPAGHDPP